MLADGAILILKNGVSHSFMTQVKLGDPARPSKMQGPKQLCWLCWLRPHLGGERGSLESVTGAGRMFRQLDSLVLLCVAGGSVRPVLALSGLLPEQDCQREGKESQWEQQPLPNPGTQTHYYPSSSTPSLSEPRSSLCT